MKITEFDNPISAKAARVMATENNDESIARSAFREIMARIRENASMGQTQVGMFKSRAMPTATRRALERMGYFIQKTKLDRSRYRDPNKYHYNIVWGKE